MDYIIIPTTLALLCTFVITPLVIKLAFMLNLVDDPKSRSHPAHVHTVATARAGGAALFAGIFIASVIFLPFTKSVFGILLAAFLCVIIGLLDDFTDISPYIRFFGNIVIAGIVVFSGIGIPFITNPFGGVISLGTIQFTIDLWGPHTIILLADILAILWIVWTMNIIGWSSGVDGQMPGFVAITAIILGFLALRFSAHDISQKTVVTLAFITAGAFLGFLPWNFFPQKIMPGYGGKTLAGLLLSTIAILSGGKIGSALIILAIPMLDAVYILLMRLKRRTSLFKADRFHLHHRLLDLGWDKRKIALFYWIVSAILGMIALNLNSTQKYFVFISIALLIFGIFIWVSNILELKRKHNHI